MKLQPFQPFKLVLTDGREFHVDHPELLVMVPGERTAIHFVPTETDSTFSIIDLLHVTTLEPLDERLPPRPPKRGRAEG